MKIMKNRRQPQTGSVIEEPTPAYNRHRRPLEMHTAKAAQAQQHIGDTPKVPGFGDRGHGPAEHYRTSSSQGHYFQDQETSTSQSEKKRIQSQRPGQKSQQKS